MTNQNANRCVFFDRDGVVNLAPGDGYVLAWDQFEFSPGIFDVLKWVKQQDILTVLVTSQRGVGKGLMQAADLEQIHSRMQTELGKEGAAFDAIYAYTETPDCPHLPKPDPEMLYSAAEKLDINLSQSWMIGDSDRDIEMGRAAGLKGCIRFLSDKNPEVDADFTVSNAKDLKEQLATIL